MKSIAVGRQLSLGLSLVFILFVSRDTDNLCSKLTFPQTLVSGTVMEDKVSHEGKV